MKPTTLVRSADIFIQKILTLFFTQSKDKSASYVVIIKPYKSHNFNVIL